MYDKTLTIIGDFAQLIEAVGKAFLFAVVAYQIYKHGLPFMG